jgi:hypothetical protein
MAIRRYLLSLPERVVRSTLGLDAGTARELGEPALPSAVRRTQLYQNLVDTTLRFLVEQVGGASGVYRTDQTLPDDCRQSRPYVRAAVSQFSPSRRTLTERLLERLASPERRRGGRRG